MNLFVNYYQAATEERQKEIDFCFEKNSQNQLINRIVIFHDKDSYLFKGIINHQEWRDIEIDRPTFQDFFELSKEYPNDINIIANSDIYFNDTLKYVENIGPNQVLALTRWEEVDGNIISFSERNRINGWWSQDCWIKRGAFDKMKDCEKAIAVDQKTNQYHEIPFTLGVPGADNHIAWKFRQAGYHVSNPSNRIKVIHLHKEESRDYGHPYRITGHAPVRGANFNTWGKLLRLPQI